MKNLFDIAVKKQKLNPKFLSVAQSPHNEVTRNMMNIMFNKLHDNDGNFIEQIQTTGFDARIFELYLFSYFYHSGFTIDRDYDRPDFMINNSQQKVAIEATTVNPTAGAVKKKSTLELNKEELIHKLENELPIKWGSPLFSKLKKEYWKLDHCKDIPFVIAIQDFQDNESLSFSFSPLVTYLYGSKDIVNISGESLEIIPEKISEHSHESKKIPSNFFNQPNTENISAVLFCNSGTVARFTRIGYQEGLYTKKPIIIRSGTAYNHEPNAVEPVSFSYDLDERINEPWGEGLLVCHNPHAKHPLAKGYFPDAAEIYVYEERVVADIPCFYPYSSQTINIKYNNEDIEIGNEIIPIVKNVVDSIFPERLIMPQFEEKEWFKTKNNKYIGIVIFDKVDNNWSYIICENQKNKYKVKEIEIDYINLKEVKKAIFSKLNSFL
jgi:hypothetical protein